MATSTKERPNVVPRPHIVAVFGGNKVEDDVAKKARTTSRQIVAHEAIVLSGGDGKDRRGQPVEDKNVKDEANAAALPHGRWISVLNKRVGQSRDCISTGRGAVVRPRTGDQRNLLEVWMSDACIVLATGAGDGTFSELVSALCLGRPVLLIGDPATWRTDPLWSQVREWIESRQVDDGSTEAITKRVREYLCKGAIWDLVSDTLTAEKLHVPDGCAFLAPGDDAAADRWIGERLDAGQVGDFPSIDSKDDTVGREFETLRAKYLEWLKGLSPVSDGPGRSNPGQGQTHA